MSSLVFLSFFFFPFLFTFYTSCFFEFILLRPGVQDGLTLFIFLLPNQRKKVFNGLGLIFAPITAANLFLFFHFFVSLLYT